MENKVKKETSCMGNTDTNNPAGGFLGMHKHSQTISKMKPKIRIIHIFAPEIIKTDVENFRELVQRLTGKPSGNEKYSKKIKPRLISGSRNVQEPRSSSCGRPDKPKICMRMELRNGFLGLDQSRETLIKEEEGGLCNGEINSGGYLGGFSDLEGFISEFGEFPLLPNWDAAHHIQEFEDPLLS